jgi:hypothetical protein
MAARPVSGHMYLVYIHTFSKGVNKSGNVWTPIAPTNNFTQDDAYVYAYTRAAFDYPTNITWKWYAPSGNLYFTDSEVWGCDQKYCDFYDRIQISGADAATMLGTWRMDLIADRNLTYSDHFQLLPYVEEEEAWRSNLTSPTHAKVALDVTIHPYNSTKWQSFGPLSIDQMAQTGNFTAYEKDTNKPLGVIHTVENSTDKVKVVFNSPEADGYEFVILFDAGAGSFGTIGGNTFLDWNWNAGVNPLPQNVTVVLPTSFTLVDATGASTHNTGTVDGRMTVSFSGTAPPNGSFDWKVTYSPIAQSSTIATVQTSSAEQPT